MRSRRKRSGLATAALFAVASHAAAVFVCALPRTAVAQEPGTLRLGMGVEAAPASWGLEVGSVFGLVSGVGFASSVRALGSEVVCDETSPTPCAPDGWSFGAGLRWEEPAGGPWWFYAEALGGAHRYAAGPRWTRFFRGGMGFGWRVGRSASVQVGLDVQRIPTDPPSLPGRARPGRRYGHMLGGLSAGVGLEVR